MGGAITELTAVWVCRPPKEFWVRFLPCSAAVRNPANCSVAPKKSPRTNQGADRQKHQPTHPPTIRALARFAQATPEYSRRTKNQSSPFTWHPCPLLCPSFLCPSRHL